MVGGMERWKPGDSSEWVKRIVARVEAKWESSKEISGRHIKQIRTLTRTLKTANENSGCNVIQLMTKDLGVYVTVSPHIRKYSPPPVPQMLCTHELAVGS